MTSPFFWNRTVPVVAVTLSKMQTEHWVAKFANTMQRLALATANSCSALAQPFTPPAVSPETMCRCNQKNSAITGMLTKSAPAANGPQCESYSPT